LARMMINITLAATSNTQHPTSNQFLTSNNQQPRTVNREQLTSRATLVVDPFCGSGNVLLEAMMLGLDAVGSDISEKAVKDSQANLKWLENKLSVTNDQLPINYQLPNFQVDKFDATSPSLIENWSSTLRDEPSLQKPEGSSEPRTAGSDSNEKIKIENYHDIIVVSEPYLGEPKKFKPSMNAARGEYQKIKELYLNFFANFKTLKPGIVLCLVFPLVETLDGQHYSLYREIVDEIKKIGYTEFSKPRVYGRDYSVVKREIALLKLD